MNTPAVRAIFYDACGNPVDYYFDEEECSIPTPTAQGIFCDDIDQPFGPPSLGPILSFLPEDEVVFDLTTQSTCASTPAEIIVISDGEDGRIDTSPNTSMEVVEVENEEDPLQQGDYEVSSSFEEEDGEYNELSPWGNNYIDYDGDANEELSINTGFTDSAYFSGTSSLSRDSSLDRAILNGLNYSPYRIPDFPGVVYEEGHGVVNEGGPHQGEGNQHQEADLDLDQHPELPEGALEFLDAAEANARFEWPDLPAGMIDVVDFIENLYG